MDSNIENFGTLVLNNSFVTSKEVTNLALNMIVICSTYENFQWGEKEGIYE